METKLSISAIVALITAFHDDPCYELDRSVSTLVLLSKES